LNEHDASSWQWKPHGWKASPSQVRLHVGESQAQLAPPHCPETLGLPATPAPPLSPASPLPAPAVVLGSPASPPNATPPVLEEVPPLPLRPAPPDERSPPTVTAGEAPPTPPFISATWPPRPALPEARPALPPASSVRVGEAVVPPHAARTSAPHHNPSRFSADMVLQYHGRL